MCHRHRQREERRAGAALNGEHKRRKWRKEEREVGWAMKWVRSVGESEVVGGFGERAMMMTTLLGGWNPYRHCASLRRRRRLTLTPSFLPYSPFYPSAFVAGDVLVQCHIDHLMTISLRDSIPLYCTRPPRSSAPTSGSSTSSSCNLCFHFNPVGFWCRELRVAQSTVFRI